MDTVKEIKLRSVNGIWTVAESTYNDVPLITKDLKPLERVLRTECKTQLREYNLKQRALRRKQASPVLTGQKG